jgi:hypothetical protein
VFCQRKIAILNQLFNHFKPLSNYEKYIFVLSLLAVIAIIAFDCNKSDLQLVKNSEFTVKKVSII